MRRRVAGIVALFALARFSFGGVIATCAPVTDPASQHGTHGSPIGTVAGIPVGHQGPCDAAGRSDCGQARHADCAASSTCATALASQRWTAASGGPGAERGTIALADVRLDPPRAPDPPPPRA
ncbi:MAG TPA: hypothetical protein VFT29_12195 [Gemmatimonadaceae bacterium]|nr:hypothetical protein [Gemmatimonadaceae bacterium]